MALRGEFNPVTIWRSAETQGQYNKLATPKAVGTRACIFCFTAEDLERRNAEQYDGLVVIENDFPYEWFDHREVASPDAHKMIIPNRHVEGLGGLTTEERHAWFDIVGKYEDQDYTTMTRAPGNPNKSIEHLHTHLFRVGLGSRALSYLNYDPRNGTTQIAFHEPRAAEAS